VPHAERRGGVRDSGLRMTTQKKKQHPAWRGVMRIGSKLRRMSAF